MEWIAIDGYFFCGITSGHGTGPWTYIMTAPSIEMAFTVVSWGNTVGDPPDPLNNTIRGYPFVRIG